MIQEEDSPLAKEIYESEVNLMDEAEHSIRHKASVDLPKGSEAVSVQICLTTSIPCSAYRLNWR